MVSRDFCFCLGGDWYSMVRMLWSRSEILIRMTRMSLLMAKSIFRRFSICSSSLVAYWIRVSLLTPSTRLAMVGEKSRATSSWVAAVSSMTSWSRAAMMDSESSFWSATIWATARGWMI